MSRLVNTFDSKIPHQVISSDETYREDILEMDQSLKLIHQWPILNMFNCLNGTAAVCRKKFVVKRPRLKVQNATWADQFIGVPDGCGQSSPQPFHFGADI